MRLDKYLSDMGIGSRSELKKEIRRGSVSVEGKVVKDPGLSVSQSSCVTFRGAEVRYEEFVYYMLNKPAGIISASEDSREPTAIDLIAEPKRKDLFPVGRLDRDTEGLLIITNDGGLAHRLLSPKNHVDKVYYVRVCGALSEADASAFMAGLVLPDGLECLPAGLEILSVSDAPGNSSTGIAGSDNSASIITEARVTIHEGKFHQVKRMFSAVGTEVMYLKRLSMGSLTLDPSLAPGEYRRLTSDELA